MLIERVDGIGIGRIGRRRQAIDLAGHADDVGRVAASGTFGVVHMDGPALDRGQGIFEEPALVERVGVQLDLEIEFIGDRQAGIDHRRHRSPVFMDLQSDAPARYLVVDGLGLRRIAAAEKSEVDRPMFGRLQHLADVEGAAAIDAHRNGAERAADHGGQTRGDGVLAKLRGIEMHMDIDSPRRDDEAFGIAHRRCRAADEVRVHTVHGRRIAGLSDVDHPPVLDADVAFDNAQNRIDHQGVAQEHVQRAHGAVVTRSEPKAVAESLAAAVQAFLARYRVVAFDDGKQRGVTEAHCIARRRTIHSRVVSGAAFGPWRQAPRKP